MAREKPLEPDAPGRASWDSEGGRRAVASSGVTWPPPCPGQFARAKADLAQRDVRGSVGYRE